MNLLVFVLCFCIGLTLPGTLAADSTWPYSMVINRREKLLQVKNRVGKVVLRAPVGIGAGGLKKKQSMDDMVTPLGVFVVDIVLASEPEFCAVDSSVLKKYAQRSEYAKYLCSQNALSQLFNDMNRLDFDVDGKPDSAYGNAYIGLNGSPAITGPKLSTYRGRIYWYSIALHGTSQEKDRIGQARSGGCIQIPADVLKRLLKEKMISPRMSVIIHD